jgi:hypothetical protein
VCKLGWHSYYKEPSWAELIQRFFLRWAPYRLKYLNFVWHFVLTSCDIYQNPFTQEKILKFWQCRTKKWFTSSYLWNFCTCKFSCTALLFFSKCRTILSINDINRIDNCYNLLNWINKRWWPLSTLAVTCFC